MEPTCGGASAANLALSRALDDATLWLGGDVRPWQKLLQDDERKGGPVRSRKKDDDSGSDKSRSPRQTADAAVTPCSRFSFSCVSARSALVNLRPKESASGDPPSGVAEAGTSAWLMALSMPSSCRAFVHVHIAH